MTEPIRINETAWRLEEGHVRFFLLQGRERAALIDTGMNSPNAKELAEGLTDLPLILINTHGDPDHISGNGGFEEVYMHPAEEAHYRSRGGAGRVIPLADGQVIDLGDRPLQIFHIPGHTPGSIAILDERNRVLISGDSVQDGNIFMFGAHRDMDTYIKSMAKLKKLDGLYDEIWAMHGSFPVYPDLPEKLLTGAKAIRVGEADPRPTDIHGRKVLLYRFPFAGFLCER